MDVKIEPSWKEILSAEFEEKYFVELVNFVKHEYGINQVYPKAKIYLMPLIYVHLIQQKW